MGRALQALINPQALSHNFQIVKQLAPNSKVMAMVKADAYGHGMSVARSLPSADAFGVACIEEAVALRHAGITQNIVLMQGFFSASELAAIMADDFEVVIHNQVQLDLLLNTKKFVKPLMLWLKINTGMNRLGFSVETAKSVFAAINTNKNFIIKGVMTHFACADELGNNFTKMQIKNFNNFCKKNVADNIPISMANSAGILKWADSHANWVRPGLMLYGISPFANISAKKLGLQQAMSLETEIIATCRVKSGEGIGYNHKFLAKQDMTLGIIAIGYADGLRLKFDTFDNTNTMTPVLINNKKVSLVGKVSMDMAAVDLTKVSNTKVGDRVVLWGRGLPVEEVASRSGFSAYELITSLGSRVARKYQSF